MPNPAMEQKQLENLSLENLLEELQHYPSNLWKMSPEKDYSLHQAVGVISKAEESWCEYLLALGLYLVVLRKKIVKNRYSFDVHSSEKGYVYSSIQKAFQLRILFNEKEVGLFEERIDSRKYQIYRQLERFFADLEKRRL